MKGHKNWAKNGFFCTTWGHLDIRKDVSLAHDVNHLYFGSLLLLYLKSIIWHGFFLSQETPVVFFSECAGFPRPKNLIWTMTRVSWVRWTTAPEVHINIEKKSPSQAVLISTIQSFFNLRGCSYGVHQIYHTWSGGHVETIFITLVLLCCVNHHQVME